MNWLERIKQHSPRGHVPVGTFLKLSSIEVVEILREAGFDFVVIDAEHAMLSVTDLNRLIAIARALGMPPLVRVPDHNYGDMQRILDAGAAGILWPHVSNAEQCRQVIAQSTHPPHGTRGSGSGMRAGGWGIAAGADYLGDARTNLARIPMIEEIEAVDQAEAILREDGVNGVFIGPGDLALTMGRRSADPEVALAVERTFKVAKKMNVPVGTLARGAADVREKMSAGYDFVMVANDTGLLARAARDLITAVRAPSAGTP